MLDGTFATAFSNPMPSFHPMDLLVGIACGAALRLAVYLKGKNTKKFRHNEEYGSARWGKHADMYEKNGQPLEVILNHMIQAVFKRPKIRPYMTDNYYAALLRQAKAEKEVENIVRLSQKETTGKQEVQNARRVKQGRPEGNKGNRKKRTEK